MLQKLHWSQILKEGKVNIPNTAVFLFTSVYWSLWTTAILSWCQGTSLHRQLFTLLQRSLCQGSQQIHTTLTVYSQDMTKRNHILTLPRETYFTPYGSLKSCMLSWDITIMPFSIQRAQRNEGCVATCQSSASITGSWSGQYVLNAQGYNMRAHEHLKIQQQWLEGSFHIGYSFGAC